MYPVIFQTDPFTLKTAGLFLLLGGVLMIQSLLALVKRKKMNIAFLAGEWWWLVIAAGVGARLLHILTEWSSYQSNMWRIFFVWDGNFNFFGGFIFFIATLFYLCHRHQESFWKWLDLISYSFLIMMISSSIGDFFGGQNYGHPPSFTFLPAFSFDNQEIPYTSALHPVQLYTALCIFLILLIMRRFFRYKRQEGVGALLCISLYFFTDFLLEFLRGTPVTTLLSYRLPQILSFGLFLGSFIWLILKTHRVSPLDLVNDQNTVES